MNARPARTVSRLIRLLTFSNPLPRDFSQLHPHGGRNRGNRPAARAIYAPPLASPVRLALVADLKAGAKTRAQVLRAVAEDEELSKAEFNRAFVLMQYFGYLRRNPNDAPDTDFAGHAFWLSKLEEFGGNYVGAEMLKAFITSDEYRRRFAQ
jgi:hypothetical protein